MCRATRSRVVHAFDMTMYILHWFNYILQCWAIEMRLISDATSVLSETDMCKSEFESRCCFYNIGTQLSLAHSHVKCDPSIRVRESR